jgi:hypothetical protein
MLDLKKSAALDIARQTLAAELAFRVQCRRNRLLGLWAANRLGIEGEAAQAYARSVVATGIEKPGDDVVVKAVADLAKKAGVDLAEGAIRVELDRLHHIAALEYAAIDVPPQSKAA